MAPDNSRNTDYRRVNSEISGGQRRPVHVGQMAPPPYDVSRLTTGLQHGSLAMHPQAQYSPPGHPHVQVQQLPSPHKLHFDDANTLKRVKGIIQEFVNNGLGWNYLISLTIWTNNLVIYLVCMCGV